VITLIKLGGTLLDAADSRERLAREIGRAVEDGLEAVVVHGGGKQMTRFLAERRHRKAISSTDCASPRPKFWTRCLKYWPDR